MTPETWNLIYPELAYPGEGVIVTPSTVVLTPIGEEYIAGGGAIGGPTEAVIADIVEAQAVQAELAADDWTVPVPEPDTIMGSPVGETYYPGGIPAGQVDGSLAYTDQPGESLGTREPAQAVEQKSELANLGLLFLFFGG